MLRKFNILLIILFCFLFLNENFGQRKVGGAAEAIPRKTALETYIVDSGKVKIWYALNAINIKDTKSYDDIQVLEIGEKHSKYNSWFKHNSALLIANWIKEHPNAKSIPNNMDSRGKDTNWSEYYSSEYYMERINKRTFLVNILKCLME